MLNGVPIGTVCPFAGRIHPVTGEKNNIFGSSSGCSSQNAQPGTLNPDIPLLYPEALGWMLCDGRYLDKDVYSELFAVLGTLYGSNNNMFRIPDYRGLFMRGVDAGSGVDPEAAQRISPEGNGTSSGIGSLQWDALQEHQHNYDAVDLAATAGSGNAGAQTSFRKPTSSPNSPALVSAYETRPKNIAVNYIIKYR
ncbi:MAG: tail fiber protein [Moorea sp. SIO4A3]|nr:tail fiber protein [Moorena sp. SIO4A3]